MSFSELGE
jgi:hypothetical protein